VTKFGDTYTAPFWYDTLLGALAPSKFSNPKAINPDKK
jgi:hypothetical protein